MQSTGRDIAHFALTWDQNQLYLFTERVGSTSNIQRFIYYADIDDDGLMETGEPVIGVAWRGGNRRVDLYLFTYVAASAGGDPMVNAQGTADGYTLPGAFANVPSSPNRSGIWGSADGLQLEFSVTWAELGVAPGSAFTFHVSSTNSSLGSNNIAGQIDDNLSGCGGGLGSTRQPNLTFIPDRALTAISGSSVSGAHTLTNTGNTEDRYDISSATSGSHTPTISYYIDTDSSGTVTPGDTQLTDTDGSGQPDTGVLLPGESLEILIAYQLDLAATGTATVTTTATSFVSAVVSSDVVDTIESVPAPLLTITKSISTESDPVSGSANPFSIPGAVMLYTVVITNSGPGTTDADSVLVTDPIPAQGALKVDDIQGAGSGPVLFIDGNPSSNLTYTFGGLDDLSDDLEFSADGGATFDYIPVIDASGCDRAVTHLRIRPGGSLAADSGSGSPSAEFRFRFRID